jgi:hypothetical protein
MMRLQTAAAVEHTAGFDAFLREEEMEWGLGMRESQGPRLFFLGTASLPCIDC